MSRRLEVRAEGDASIAVGGNIESATTNITYISAISALPLAVAAKDPSVIYAAVDAESFTGRGWLVTEIDRFIGNHPCGYVFIEAEAGLGKTAFAASLVRNRGYVSHFSRYAGGRSVRTALQNLSAQLIIHFRLDHLAPAEIFPEWAQSPAGFESILGQAAERARRHGRPVVLVVDGLDEADPSGQGPAFGLPTALPDGTYIVGTYRTGYSPGCPDSPSRTLLIGRNDSRNQDDIRQFLQKATAKDVLAAKLAEAGTGPAEIIDQLASRSAGVWVYLRYVLEELRLGLRHPSTVGDLPSGLWNYYADQIRRWQQDPAWHSSLLPLLATLAVAGEPLPATALARLSGGLDLVAVRRGCDYTLRPVLTTTRPTVAGSPLRYEIHHPSLREIIKDSHHDRPLALQAEGPSELEALSDELRRATVAAHARVADSYLTGFGGLAADLPLLGGNPFAASIDDGYPLRHLARHLVHAGRLAELHRLLMTAHHVTGSLQVNTWFAAHDSANCLTSYLDDLARARDSYAALTNQALTVRQPAPTLGTEIRYALMAASITSRTNGIPDLLLEQLMDTGMWSLSRGLDHARRLTRNVDRVDALLTIYKAVNADEKPPVADEAVAAATAIASHIDRAAKLTVLARHLPEDQRPHLLALALKAAIAIPDYDYRDRAKALADLAPHLPLDLLPEALAAAITLAKEHNVSALISLAPYLPLRLLAEALTAATAITNDRGRAWALTRLAPWLPAEQQQQAIAEALDIATAITDKTARADALTDLVSRLPADQQPRVLAAATAIISESSRADALTALGPHLPAELMTEALAAAAAITDDIARATAIDGLAPHLPAQLMARAVAAASTIDNRYFYFRATALTRLAAHMTVDQRTHVLAQVLASTAAVDDSTRSGALIDMAPLLPQDLMAKALATAAGIKTDFMRALTLIGMARHLRPGQKAAVLAQALAAATAVTNDRHRADLLEMVAYDLTADQKPGVLALALAAATAISDHGSRTAALTGLCPYLLADQQEQVLTHALSAASAITDDAARAGALTGLVPRLSEGQRQHVVSEIMTAATAITDDAARASALTGLVPRLSEGQRQHVVSEIMTAATAITDDHTRARALTAVAPHLPQDLMTAALATARAMTNDAARADALTGLAPHLPAELMGEALAVEALAADSPMIIADRRAKALIALAPRLPRALMSEALAAAATISRKDFRAEALTGLAPHLPPDVMAQALAAANKLGDLYYRAWALTGLAPHLPAELMGQAAAAAYAIKENYWRARVLTALAPHLPADQQSVALAEALAAASAVTSDNGRAKALTALAPHLPADQQSVALARAKAADTAAKTKSFNDALNDLAILWPPDLPADLVVQAPTAALQAIRMRTASPEKRDPLLIEKREDLVSSLRSRLVTDNRSSCLRTIELHAGQIYETGGQAAIQECMKAILETYEWWS
ncbi:MAG: hypothetical protein ACRDOL_16110 [Streptosporangiaceae bacterium]